MNRARLLCLVAVSVGLAAFAAGSRPSPPGPAEVRVARGAAPALSAPVAEVRDREPEAKAPAARRGVAVAAPPRETSLMDRLHDLSEEDAVLAVELAREGNRLFPEGEGAPERASIVVHALASQGLAAEARGEAEEMVNRYPDSAWAREIEGFTGAHRRRDLRLSDNGELESY